MLIEKGAGSPSYFSDMDYEAAGAKIVEKDDVWKSSDIVMKVWQYNDDWKLSVDLNFACNSNKMQLFDEKIYSYAHPPLKKSSFLKTVPWSPSYTLIKIQNSYNNFKIKSQLHLQWIASQGLWVEDRRMMLWVVRQISVDIGLLLRRGMSLVVSLNCLPCLQHTILQCVNFLWYHVNLYLWHSTGFFAGQMTAAGKFRTLSFILCSHLGVSKIVFFFYIGKVPPAKVLVIGKIMFMFRSYCDTSNNN